MLKPIVMTFGIMELGEKMFVVCLLFNRATSIKLLGSEELVRS